MRDGSQAFHVNDPPRLFPHFTHLITSARPTSLTKVNTAKYQHPDIGFCNKEIFFNPNFFPQPLPILSRLPVTSNCDSLPAIPFDFSVLWEGHFASLL